VYEKTIFEKNKDCFTEKQSLYLEKRINNEKKFPFFCFFFSKIHLISMNTYLFFKNEKVLKKVQQELHN